MKTTTLREVLGLFGMTSAALVDKILIIIAKLSINEPIQKAVADLLM